MGADATPSPAPRRPRVRRSDCALVALGALALALVASLGHGVAARPEAAARTEHNRQLVRALELTDLCLFTEARYTRHLTQADLHTPFQDAPFSLDHFPSGSVVGPPAILTARPHVD